MNALCITLLLCLVGIACSKITKDTEPCLCLCKADVEKTSQTTIPFKCCVDETLKPGAKSELKHGADTIATNAEVSENCITKNVPINKYKKDGSYTCSVTQDMKTSKTSDKVSAKGTDCVTEATKTELKICKKGDKIKFTCEVKLPLNACSTLKLTHSQTPINLNGKDEVKGNSITKTVSKTDYEKAVKKFGPFQCQVRTCGATSKISGVFTGKHFKELEECPAKKSSAPRLVNSSAVAVVCLLTACIKFIY